MEREPPVGSSDSEMTFDAFGQSSEVPFDGERVRILENEREDLQKSMISLTSRLAQVLYFYALD